MDLMSRGDFLRRKGVDIATAVEYDQFMDWVPTLGMFVQCKNENEPLIKGLCTEEEWETASQLLVFKDFDLDDYGDGFAAVTNGSCYLIFQGINITDESDGMSLNVRWIEDLVEHELGLTHPW